MEHRIDPSGERRTIGQRVGFWLGLLLFAVPLALPTPGSMVRAVERKAGEDKKLAAELKAETAALLDARGHADAAADSADYRSAHADCIAARARRLLTAAAITVLVACWWITVAIPIPATSLLPLILFPLLGVMPIKEAAIPYANSNVFLFMGGFIIALGLERCGLHRRIALHIVRLVGTGPATIVLGFMIASAFLSMWISNTATAMMMLPIGLAVIAQMPDLHDGVEPTHAVRDSNFACALMLGIAYAASLGGIATPIGTPPNISFRGQLARLFPDAPEISFAHWMVIFVPMVVVFLAAVWLVLVRVTCPLKSRSAAGAADPPAGRGAIREHIRRLGRMAWDEKAMLVVFLATALLWMTRSIELGTGRDVGWAALMERLLRHADGTPGPFRAAFIDDATIAMGMALLLFLIPSRRAREGDASPGRLMDWETATRLPWGILLLFGGGFCIAAGFTTSGLSYWCGQTFAGLGLHSPLALVLCTCLVMTFLTELTSNTATTEIMLPILAGVAPAMGVNPLVLMLPATVSASCAFMLPVATPPNAIVFGSGRIPMSRMVRSGLIINLIGVLLVAAAFFLLAAPILGIDPAALPPWAK
ncbi:MAG: Sodium-dependent dicarboxylate transporter SdcS [Phycisphaerae bacterium]|nr:Sodium-dependent dicarboxylate transporter SdcS [Phycisphaerae bacterium]